MMLCLPQHTASRFWSKLSLLCTCTSQWIKEEEVRYTTEIIIILHSSLYPCLFTEWLCSNSHKAVYVPTPWFHECLITSFTRRMHPKWHIRILNLDLRMSCTLQLALLVLSQQLCKQAQASPLDEERHVAQTPSLPQLMGSPQPIW